MIKLKKQLAHTIGFMLKDHGCSKKAALSVLEETKKLINNSPILHNYLIERYKDD